MSQNISSFDSLNVATLSKKSKTLCIHCGSKINQILNIKENQKDENIQFCCKGCVQAWSLIHDLGLSSFYKMTQDVVLPTPRDTQETNNEEYLVFDSPEFQKEFVSIKDKTMRAELLIEGVTCYACTWLIKHALGRTFDGISMELNQSSGAASLSWTDPTLLLSDIVRFIDSLGYRVLPHRDSSLAADHSELIKVGVSLFIMVNVMSFALVEYFSGADGVDPTLKTFIRWISLVLTTISLAWPGQIFILGTWRSIRSRMVGVDAPILLGLFSAYIYSIVNTLQNGSQLFFDSICAVIALVLSGRYIQQLALKRNQTKLAALIRPNTGYALVERQGEFVQTPSTSIQPGDLVKILPGQLLPLKIQCTVTCPEYSLGELNGEPQWRIADFGAPIPAGAVNGRTAMEGVALEAGADSYSTDLGRMVQEALNKKGDFQRWSDKAAWSLFLVVLAVALGVFAYFIQSSPHEAFQRAVSILLIACPCTFAIAVPLTFATSMSRALSLGILFRNQLGLERLSTVGEIIFDKTGTLTVGTPEVVSEKWLCPESEIKSVKIILSFLSQHTSHHVGIALSKLGLQSDEYKNSNPSIKCTELIGHGLKLEIDEQTHIMIGNPNWILSLGIQVPEAILPYTVIIAKNQKAIGAFELDDKIRCEASLVVASLQKSKYKIGMLSGDSVSRTKKVASQLNIPVLNAIGQATPDSKSDFVKSKEQSKGKPNHVAMVGNGLNDSVAMANATVGIAVCGASNPAQVSADVCLLQNDLALIPKTIEISRAAVKRMKASFVFAATYNLIGLGLAATGHMSPLLAAVLMPISSLTVTRISTRFKNPKSLSGGY